MNRVLNNNNNSSSSVRKSSSKKNRKSSKNKSAELKVVYISSPMKVKTCASNFRSTVQQLTGRDSDVVDRLMDEYANNNNNNNLSNEIVHTMGGSEFLFDYRRAEIPVTNSYESPTSSGSLPFAEFGGEKGGGFSDEGFSFEDIFGASGLLLEYPLDDGMYV
ncbi:hypothetical protein QQ045_005533 [Rhodiola kirilowii]